MAFVFYYKGMLEKVLNDAKNPAVLGFFLIKWTQLNAVHAQLLKKLRPIAFVELADFSRSSH